MHETHHAQADPAHVLEEEHAIIQRLVHALDGMGTRLRAGEDVPLRDVYGAIEALQGFADRCHHAKEEKVLFPALGRAGADLARELEADHRAGRALVASLGADASAAVVREREAVERFATNANAYATLLDAHIQRETESLLPLVRSLDDAARDRVAEAFERVEQVESGEGAHARYEAVVDRLAGAYA